jgi:hypothetical protein
MCTYCTAGTSPPAAASSKAHLQCLVGGKQSLHLRHAFKGSCPQEACKLHAVGAAHTKWHTSGVKLVTLPLVRSAPAVCGGSHFCWGSLLMLLLSTVGSAASCCLH